MVGKAAAVDPTIGRAAPTDPEDGSGDGGGDRLGSGGVGGLSGTGSCGGEGGGGGSDDGEGCADGSGGGPTVRRRPRSSPASTPCSNPDAVLALLSTGLCADLAAVVVAEPRVLCAKDDAISRRIASLRDRAGLSLSLSQNFLRITRNVVTEIP
nr:uncharacterized protein LOC112936216 [Oryza sativa Japonica Group]